jgi:hypothetical protein
VPTVDLSVKYLHPEIRVWRLYPGEFRDFAEPFLETGSVFLDLPGVTLGPRSLDDRRLLNAHIGRAWALREWYRAPETEKPAFPPNLQEFLDLFGSRSTGQQCGNIRQLYYEVKTGDVIVVPVAAGFESYLMIGEITDAFHPDDHHRIPIYGNERIPFRRVKWINSHQRTRILSPTLVHWLAGRRAIRPLVSEFDEPERDKLYAEIFEVSYQNFIFKDLSEYLFEAPEYKQKPLDIFPGAELIAAILAYGNTIVDQNLVATGQMSVSAASISAFAEEGVEAFEVDFASPGFYRIKMRGRTTVLLAAVAIVACLRADFFTEMGAVQVENPTPIPIDLAGATRDLVEQIVEETGLPKIRDLADLERQAHAKVGLQSRARARR